MGCTNESNKLNEFISEFNETKFGVLKGYGVYKRGLDAQGNTLVYLSRTLNSDEFSNSGNIVVAIDSNSQIQYTDSKADIFGLNVDTVEQVALLLE